MTSHYPKGNRIAHEGVDVDQEHIAVRKTS